MTTFLDTNVLIFLLDEGAQHHAWAAEQLALRKEQGPIIISDIVYCEFCVGMNSREDADAAVTGLALERLGMSDGALYRAAQAFKQYKDNGGQKKRVLPDFLIGATAELANAPLLTANADDFDGFFPTLELIAP
jgi:predicted nucleic acid-binding protein